MGTGPLKSPLRRVCTFRFVGLKHDFDRAYTTAVDDVLDHGGCIVPSSMEVRHGRRKARALRELKRAAAKAAAKEEPSNLRLLPSAQAALSGPSLNPGVRVP